jgi:hypothetical protein
MNPICEKFKMKNSSCQKSKIELTIETNYTARRAVLLSNHYSGWTICVDDQCHQVKDREKQKLKKAPGKNR